MRKLIFALAAIITAISLSACAGTSRETIARTMSAKLYFVDAELFRLIPVSVNVTADTDDEAAQALLNELIAGRDSNKSIRRIMPNIDGALTVHIRSQIAYVDISQEFADEHPADRDSEILTVYSIVNTLTSLKSVTNVRFTIAGERRRDFKGAIDMRETFIPDYFE